MKPNWMVYGDQLLEVLNLIQASLSMIVVGIFVLAVVVLLKRSK